MTLEEMGFVEEPKKMGRIIFRKGEIYSPSSETVSFILRTKEISYLYGLNGKIMSLEMHNAIHLKLLEWGWIDDHQGTVR